MKRNRSILLSAFLIVPLAAVGSVAASSLTGSTSDPTAPNPTLTAEDALRASKVASQSTTALTSPARKAIDSQPVAKIAPPQGVPVLESATNDNDSSSPLGQLCWYRRELVLALVGRISVNNGQQAKSNQRDPLAVAAQLQTWKGASALPVDVRPFAERLRSDAEKLASAAKTDNVSLATSFDFENYPNAKLYLDEARKDPGCREP